MSRRSKRLDDQKTITADAKMAASSAVKARKRQVEEDVKEDKHSRRRGDEPLRLTKSADELVEDIRSSADAFDIDQVRALVEALQQNDLERLAGARREAQSALKDLEHERERLRTMLHYEHKILDEERARLRRQGCADVEESMKTFAIIGVDEVGVGPLAGPCVGGAVCLWLGNGPAGQAAMLDEHNFGLARLHGVNDSKKLKPFERDALDKRIRTSARAFALGVCTSQEVDMLNNRNASMEVMRRSVMTLLNGALAGHRVHLLVDYHTVPDMPEGQVVGQTCLEKGDAKSQSIGAASIIAKVHRDAYMQDLHRRYPHFGFDKNAGYGTRDHMGALQRGVLCPEHRLSFAPVRTAFERCKDEEEYDGQDADERRATMKVLSVHYEALTAMQAQKLEAAKAEKLAKAMSKSAKPLKQRFEPNATGPVADGVPVKPNDLTAWLKKA
jgi:ribonuclease HII